VSIAALGAFKEAGKTIVLVTHSMTSVTTFCDRAILLDKGKLIADGEPNCVTSIYHHLQFGELDPASVAPDGATAAPNESPLPPLQSADQQHPTAQTGEDALMDADAPVCGTPVFVLATPEVYAPMVADIDAVWRAPVPPNEPRFQRCYLTSLETMMTHVSPLTDPKLSACCEACACAPSAGR
jgi:hypothetical protein